MSDHAKDWLWLLLCVAMFAAIPLGFLCVLAGWKYVGIALVSMGGAASVGCVRLVVEFARHGIHNTR